MSGLPDLRWPTRSSVDDFAADAELPSPFAVDREVALDRNTLNAIYTEHDNINMDQLEAQSKEVKFNRYENPTHLRLDLITMIVNS